MNRTQRVRRFRLASLAFAMVTVLAVSLPTAVPALAASGDKLKFDQTSVAAGTINSQFTLKISSNTVTAMQGVTAGFDFNYQYLNIVSISRLGTACDPAATPGCLNASNYWASADQKPSGTTAANANTGFAGPTPPANSPGNVNLWSAAYSQNPALIGETIPVNQDVQFLSVTFKVVACPANGVIPPLSGTSDTGAIQLVPATGAPNIRAASQFSDTSGNPVTPTAADLTAVSVSCTPPPPDDFSLAANPTTVSVTLPSAGTNSGATTITSTKVSGNALTANLTTSALPAGVTAAFSSAPGNTITAGGPSVTLTFTVSTAASTNGSGVPITVTGTAGTTVRTAIVTLVILPTPAGPSPATGQTVVSGTVDGGYLGVQVNPTTSLTLKRNWLNTTSVPVLVFTNTQFTLSIEDAMLNSKLASNRGHMTDNSAVPAKFLTNPMSAKVGANPVRTLDIVGPQSLMSDTSGTTQTVNVGLTQLTVSTDPPGSYAIDITFSAISGF